MPHEQLTCVLRRLGREAGPAAPEWADAQLLERYACCRDQEAFAALVRRYGRLVRSVCWRVLHQEQDAEDAFQATFLVFATRAASIRKTTGLASWLHGVAFRTAMNTRRARVRQSKGTQRSGGCTHEEPALTAALREIQLILDEEVSRLAEKYRLPFVLCCLDGKSKAEAARHLGWKEGTVSGRLAQARKELQRRLSRRGVALSAALCGLELSRAAAAVAPSLLNRTVKGALSFAAGKAVAPELVSAAAVARVKGAMRGMLTTKLKIAALVLLAVGVGGGWLTCRALAAKPTAPQEKKAPEASSGTARKGGGEAVVIGGRVLDAQGQPLPGAKVYLWTRAAKKATDLAVRATAGADGRFRFEAARADLEVVAWVVAIAKGHGPEWRELGNAAKPAALTLRLVKDDVPVEGRVLDLEGQPVAGVRAEVHWLYRGREPLPRFVLHALGVPTSATSGKDGRFRLAGFGRGRTVDLHLTEPTVESSFARVHTRPGPAANLPFRTFTAKFDLQLEPGKVIHGTVRDKRTGKPLAGIRVSAGMAWATTDKKGQYLITGVAKGRAHFLSTAGAPYLSSVKPAVKDTPGLEPVTVDFQLERGIAIRGRLTDKATGKPVRGRVVYLAKADNPHVKDFGDLIWANVGNLATQTQTGADGSFALVGIPGPGWLCVVATGKDAHRYTPAEIEDWEDFLRALPFNRENNFHGVVAIDPSADKPKSTTVVIALEPGRTRTGTVVGPDGKPLAGAHVAGLTAVPQVLEPIQGPVARFQSELKTADFTAQGLSPRKPRKVVFIHPKKKLGKVLLVRGDQAGPLTVRLGPLGAITGRVLDADGRPWAGLTVQVHPPHLRGFPDFDDAFRTMLNVKQTTDREGKFRIEGLLPGVPYGLSVVSGVGRAPYYLPSLPALKSGATTDLGDLKSKLSPETTKE